MVEQKPIERIDDQTLVFADVGRKAIEQVRCAARDMLGGRMADDAADKLAHKLSEGTWTHDYPTSATEAKALGLNVNTDMPSDILDLLALYPQPMRTQGGVEYLPGPRAALRALNLVSEVVQLGAGKKLSKRRSSELFSYNVFLVIFGAARFSRSAVMESSPLCMHRACSRVGSRFLPFAKKRTRSAGSITEEKMSVWSDQEANSNRGRDHRRWT